MFIPISHGSGYKTANNITAKLQNSKCYKTAKLQNSEITKQRMLQKGEITKQRLLQKYNYVGIYLIY